MIFQDFFFSKIFAVLAESVIKFPLDFYFSWTSTCILYLQQW